MAKKKVEPTPAPQLTQFEIMREGVSELMDATAPVPKMNAVLKIQGAVNKTASCLHAIRRYLLDTPALGGEKSPFVHKIDEILPRTGGK